MESEVLMATTWDHAIAEVLESEGVLSEDPRDTGGVTKYGISKAAYPHLDIRSLTRQDAIDIYRRDYWAKTGALIEDIDPPLAIALFDFGVNSGPATAVIALQKTLGVQADGVIGPKTRAAIERADDSLLIRFLAERLLLMATFKTFPVHGRGWYRRVAGLGYRLGRMEAAQGMDDARTLIDALVRTARALGVLK
jgi:lysozyme family protein